MRDLAPDIVLQRLLIEGLYERDLEHRDFQECQVRKVATTRWPKT